MKKSLSSSSKRLTGIVEYIDVPFIILIAAAVLLWLNLISFGEHPARISRDSDSYRYFDFSSTHAVLSSIVTLGYPVFLRVIWTQTGSVDALPAIQLAFIVISVVFYFFAIRKYTASSWIGLFAALPIFNTQFVFNYYDVMASDALGCAMMICTLSIVVNCNADTRRATLLALGLSLFLTYQIRPAYLYLVILAPCLYFVLRVIKTDVTDIGKGLLSVMLYVSLPLIAFCLLRLIIVGHFGLVSFGAYNVTGITSSLIYPKVIDSISDENRAVANDIYFRRLRKGYKSIQEKVKDNDGRIYLSWQNEYAENTYTIAVPAIKRHAELNHETYSTPYINEKLSGLAREVILLEPVYYSKWVIFQMISGIYRTIFDGRENFWLSGLLTLVVAIRIFRKGLGSFARIPASIHGPAIIAGSCFFSGLLLVALVEPTIDRYIQAVGIFIPGALLVYIVAGQFTSK